MQNKPDYGPRVTWEQLDEGVRIYYTGDAANAGGGGLILKRLPIEKPFNWRQVKIEMDDGREWRAIELAAFQPGPGRRFWLESDWNMRREQMRDQLARLVTKHTPADPVEAVQAERPAPASNAASIGVRELATILAALRLFQRLPSEASGPENEIATDSGEFEALSLVEIDALCERLNAKPVRRRYYEAKDKANSSGITTRERPQTLGAAAPVVPVAPVEPVETAKPEAEKFRAVAVGDIFVASWGYDQTNVDFYEVVRLTKTQAYIRPIGAASDDGGGYSGKKTPKKGAFTGEETRHAVKYSWGTSSKDEPYMKVEGHYARLWDGKPQSYTSYA